MDLRFGSLIYLSSSLECIKYCSWSCQMYQCYIITVLNIKCACFDMSCFTWFLGICHHRLLEKGKCVFFNWAVYFFTPQSAGTCVFIFFSRFSPCLYFSRQSARFSQHRRKKRKEMDEGIPEANQHKQSTLNARKQLRKKCHCSNVFFLL